MLIVTNFRAFPERWVTSDGGHGESVEAHTYQEFARHRKNSNAVYLINCDPMLTLKLAATSILPGEHPPLIAVDLVLRRPTGWVAHAAAPVRRLLLSRVDYFIHYFRDLSGYEQLFGIGPDRSCFVPFKSNLSDRHKLDASNHGDYVLCFGRSLRDFDTFFDAMELVPFPGAIARPLVEELRRHGARFSRASNELPANVQVLDDDGSEAAQIRILQGAKLVVLPILKSSLVASGISTCLNAMMFGKCVIASAGPGTTDVFLNGEILTVPAENPGALAEAIRIGWEDEFLRRKTASAGRAYAAQAGGEKELYSRIIDAVARWRRDRSAPSG